ncbi:DUF4105 domain-containing protein [Sulfurimonas sp.]|uniref:Lnb N-terminal periplasmic domain-containing protein n=1 Tax=Sulfurimonas sp. TaxID=2022749 RepID=UPI002AAF2A46|nr:DUF4105 domain-containing protein [Sulfurimonas sp.]
MFFLLSSIFAIISLKLKRFRFVAWVVYIILFSAWFLWYENIQPSNDKNWQKDVAVLSYATQDNNLITVHNIRNFKYITENRYEISYYNEIFDINKLRGIDFITTYWMGPNIAHTFLSFSFGDNKHLAISIEARKKVGESFSIIRGFFKESELIYVVADERDLIGLRTNIRKNPPEQVYMYKIDAKLEDKQKVFLNYIKKINSLKNRPEFYNTLITNCTTSIWDNSLVNYSNMRLNWEILLSGYTANFLYNNNLLITNSLSFKELRKKAYINPLVDYKSIEPNYSYEIRK